MNARGPDFQNQYGPISFTSNYHLTFAVSVLALRGYKQQQPFIDEDGNILLYNGEIYEGDLQVCYVRRNNFYLSCLFLLLKINPDDNDGIRLSQRLKQCENADDICKLISTLEGCFAFIYFQVKMNKNN